MTQFRVGDDVFGIESGANAEESKERPREDRDAFDALRVHGLSRFSCMSRGPAAPPEDPFVFENRFTYPKAAEAALERRYRELSGAGEAGAGDLSGR